MKNKLFAVFALPLLAAFSFQVSTAHAQNTTFTYQGRLLDNGTNFAGNGQFEFALVTSTNFNHTATATANPPSGGFITGYVVAAGGSGYVTAPAVTIFGGGGSGAAATANLSGGVVSSLTVNNPGNGAYTSAPTVTIAPPPANISYATHWSNDGTSVNGSEPAASVVVGVTNGLFTVVLGDPTVPNMLVIGAALFNQPNLQLRIWFNDGVNGFAALSPVQNLTPAPYATYATSAGGVPGLVVQANTNGAPNLIEGAANNYVSSGVIGATIAGGGAVNYQGMAYSNTVAAVFGTVSGGLGNTASGTAATVGGGQLNTASLDSSTVSGGYNNLASNGSTTVDGGFNNIANGNVATVGGGGYNNAGGAYSVIAGGKNNHTTNSYTTIGGGYGNYASNNFATVSGGYGNVASGYGATVAGGGEDGINAEGNEASGAASFVGGGLDNVADGPYSFVGGGENNEAGGYNSMVLGGSLNFASGGNSSVCGGSLNSATGVNSTVPCGVNNLAEGINSFAAGNYAHAYGDGSFAWSDNLGIETDSIASNSVTFRASGGYRFLTGTGTGGAQLLPNATSWTTLSDRNAKKNFQPVDYQAVLDKLASVPIQQWNYKWEKDTDVPNLGPMAQDFKHAFYPGRDDKGISTLEFDGVELAAIQGLNEKVESGRQKAETRLEKLEVENAELKARLEKLERLMTDKTGGAQ